MRARARTLASARRDVARARRARSRDDRRERRARGVAGERARACDAGRARETIEISLPSRAATDRDVRSGVGRRAVVVLWAKGGDESFKVFRETRARTRARAEGRAIDDPMGGY